MKEDKHKNLKYPVRTIRVSKEIWKDLQKKKDKSGLTWNLFIKELLNKQDENLARKINP